jgi:hypothetical protein
MPTFRTDLRVHYGVQKNSAAIVTPRPPEINAVLRVAAGQTTSIENKSRGLIRRKSHRRGDVSVALAVYVTVLKKRRSLPEDKIHVSLNVTVLVKLTAVLGIERVLPSEKTAILENRTVRFDKNCDRL